jgi:hypothetical protein
MTDWQPMSTAPKDGTKILACDVSGRFSPDRLFIVMWDANEPHWPWTGDGERYPADTFTHWTPRPEPPK